MGREGIDCDGGDEVVRSGALQEEKKDREVVKTNEPGKESSRPGKRRK